MVVPGKERRRGKYSGYRSDWKKAYVTLREGEKMIEYGENL
jgi:large subunit ribosomal protein L23